MTTLQKLAKELTTVGREHIKTKNFALPGDRYPIHDLSHARNALARVSQHGTSEEQATVRSKVYSKYPALKERTMEKKSSFEEIKRSIFIDELNKIASEEKGDLKKNIEKYKYPIAATALATGLGAGGLMLYKRHVDKRYAEKMFPIMKDSVNAMLGKTEYQRKLENLPLNAAYYANFFNKNDTGLPKGYALSKVLEKIKI